MPIAAIWDPLEDAFNTAKDAASDVVDAVVDVLGSIPMAPELYGALKDVVEGPLRDFAKTPLGVTMLRALSTTVYGPFAYIVGPQLAAITFALPGLARGQDFLEAWYTEFSYRVEKGAEHFGAQYVDEAKQQVETAIQTLESYVPEEFSDLSLREAAKRLGVSDWAAAMGLSMTWPDIFPIPAESDFDLVTGNLRVVSGDAVDFSSWGRDPTMLRTTEQIMRDALRLPSSPTMLRTTEQIMRDALRELPRSTSMLRRSDVPSSAPSPVAVPAPVAVSAADGDPARRTKQVGDVLLVATITAAAGAMVWFYVGEKRR